MSTPKKTTPATPGPTEAPIQIQRLSTEVIAVPVIGTTPLIIHRFTEKAKKQMLDGMQGVKNLKAPKDPEQDYLAAFYRMDDGACGVPTLGLKSATVGAARYFGKSVTMVGLKQALFFVGETTKSTGELLTRLDTHTEPWMREDVVTVGINGHDLRYRPQFDEWSLTLTIRYVTSSITRDSVVALVDAGGMGGGLGEWRPEKGKAGGQYGTFTVDPSRNIEVVS